MALLGLSGIFAAVFAALGKAAPGAAGAAGYAAAGLGRRAATMTRWWFLAGVAGLVLIGMSALRLADTALLVSVPTAMFLCVYLSCMVSAVRILSAGTRAAAAVAVLAVLAVLAFCGWALLAAAAVAVVAAPRC